MYILMAVICEHHGWLRGQAVNGLSLHIVAVNSLTANSFLAYPLIDSLMVDLLTW